MFLMPRQCEGHHHGILRLASQPSLPKHRRNSRVAAHSEPSEQALSTHASHDHGAQRHRVLKVTSVSVPYLVDTLEQNGLKQTTKGDPTTLPNIANKYVRGVFRAPRFAFHYYR
jgi:hypothetical protein